MTTYGTVVVLVIGAALLVVLAIWFQVVPGGRSAPRRWVALGSSGTTGPGRRSWVSAIATSRRAEAIDLTAPGATLAEVRASQLGPAIAAIPSVAVIWVGVEDLLHGVALSVFQRDLLAVIAHLQAHGCEVVVVGLPPFGVEGGRPWSRRRGALAETTEQWRSALAATAELTGGTLVRSGSDGAPESKVQVTGTVARFDEQFLAATGRRVAPVLSRLLGAGVRATSGPARWDQPADPVVRRRLGLPPVR